MNKCPNCGNYIDENAIYCSNCSSVVSDMPNQDFINRYQPDNKPIKKSNSSFIFIVLLMFIAGVAGWKYFFGVQKVFDGTPMDKVNDYEYYNDNECTLTGKKIKYKDFTFTIPTNLFSKVDDGLYINNIVLSYQSVIKTQNGSVYNAEMNKNDFIEVYEKEQGTVDVFENKTINNKNFLIIKSHKNNINYYMLLTQATEDYVFIVTIGSEKDDNGDDIINEIATIITSAQKN